MALFSELRSLALLRRIARALESIRDSQHTLARLAVEADERRVMEGYRPMPKRMQIGVFDPVAASRQWRKMMVESGQSTYEELEEEHGPLPESG